MQKYKGVISDKEYLTDKVIRVTLTHREPAEMDFTSGQYFMIRVGKGVLRAYSIGSADTEKHSIQTYVDITPGGPGSKFFEGCNEGDEVEYMGPNGKFMFEHNDRPDIFISTGTGVVPFLSMILSAVKVSKKPIYLLQGSREEKDVFLKDLLDKLQEENENFSYDFTFSREEKEGALHGRVTDNLDQIIEKYGKDIDAYICGSRDMVKDTEQKFLDLGVSPENIKYEKYN